VTIPGASHNPNGNCSPGCPTGTVANASGSSTLTVSAASTPPTGGYPYNAALLPGLGVGTVLTRRRPLSRKRLAGMSALGLLLLSMLFTLGCGSNSQKSTPAASQTTVTVTGTSGALSHSVPISVTVN
jgi:hypothetical protein